MIADIYKLIKNNVNLIVFEKYCFIQCCYWVKCCDSAVKTYNKAWAVLFGVTTPLMVLE